MAPLQTAVAALYAVVAALGWRVARRDRSHRLVAGYVAWMFALEILLPLLQFQRAGAPRPYTGLARATFHAEEFLILSQEFLFVALCVHHFLRRRPWAILGAWAMAFALMLDYPRISKDAVVAVYRVVGVGGTALAWGCILWGLLRKRDVEPGLAHLVLILYACIDVVQQFVPVAGGIFGNWDLARTANVVLLVALVAAHARWLLRGPPKRRTGEIAR